MASLGAGNVDVAVGEETITLKPTLKAAQTLSRQSGGLSTAINRVGALDIDTIVSVIAVGSGVATGKDIEALAEKVFAAGPASMVEPVVRFLVNLANGGKPPVAGASTEENPQT